MDMKKLILVLLLVLLLIPVVYAEEPVEEEEEESCGLLNLASCIPHKIYDFFINLINAPIKPLLNFIKSLLTEPVEIGLFVPLWAIMLYIISLFYGILMLYSGFNFMVSGYDSAKRAKAKEWFKNIFIMIVLVQASYFLYALTLDVSSLLTSGVVNLIDPNFFLLTADNIVNIGLEFMFGILYAVILLISVLFLTLRYVIVATGVIIAPIGIFLYFIPPTKDYGKLILNFLAVAIFITFLDAIIFLVCSKLVEITLFASFKILIMITAFAVTNFLMFYLMLFSALKSAFNTGEGMVEKGKTVVAVAKYFI